jgi:hypothetical protein
MNDDLAEKLLIKVMNWEKHEVTQERPFLQAIAAFKYDEYQQFTPGMKFIESLALWLHQFKKKEEKQIAYDFVKNRLIFVSNSEMMHLVSIAYADCIQSILIERVAHEIGCSEFEISKIVKSEDFRILRRQSLFLGLSDGARIDVFRRFSRELNHEQIWPIYDISNEKAKEMQEELERDLRELTDRNDLPEPKFKAIFLLDDFSGSGRSYLRIENKNYKGKIFKIYQELFDENGALRPIVTEDLMVYVVLYVATNMAERWIRDLMGKLLGSCCRYDVRVIQHIDDDYKVGEQDKDFVKNLVEKYYDKRIEDKYTEVGGSEDLKFGFANCALPLVLHHNTPNNSIALLWSYEDENADLRGLFPRVKRHGVV